MIGERISFFEVKEICGVGVGVGVGEGERGEVFYAKEDAREDQKKSRAWELNMLLKSEKAYGSR